MLNNVLHTDLSNNLYGIAFTGLLSLTCIYTDGYLLTYKSAGLCSPNAYLMLIVFGPFTDNFQPGIS